jgi:hypothetical protein
VNFAGRDGDRYAVGDWGCDQRCICSSVAEGILMRTGLRRSTTVGDEGGRGAAQREASRTPWAHRPRQLEEAER